MNSPEHDAMGPTAGAEPDPRDDETTAGDEAAAPSRDAVRDSADSGDDATGTGDDSGDESGAGEGDAEPTGASSGDGAMAAPASEHTESAHVEAAQIGELRAERDLARDRHLRLAADFDNYRRRTEDRLRRRWNRAQADLVSRMLEPLDDLLRVTALEPEGASVEAIVEGVDLVERKFFRVLEEAGVEVVDPAGEKFDPNTMEAMMRVPAGAEERDDTVERVFQRGYTFKGLLVRPARVSVYKA